MNCNCVGTKYHRIHGLPTPMVCLPDFPLATKLPDLTDCNCVGTKYHRIHGQLPAPVVYLPDFCTSRYWQSFLRYWQSFLRNWQSFLRRTYHSHGKLDHSRGLLTQLCIILTPRSSQLLLLVDLHKASGNLHIDGDKQVVLVAAHQVVYLHSGGIQQVVLGAAHQLLLLVDLRKRQYHKLYCNWIISFTE